METRKQITTRDYKIKASVIGILAVLVYIASQYMMFCNLPVIESTGERVETNFLKWAINRNAGCIAIGIILILIPYEWLADNFIKNHEKKLKHSAAYRIYTIIGAGIILTLVATILATIFSIGHLAMTIICCAGSVIALGIFVFPLFENKLSYQGYIAIVGFISMVSIYVLMLYEKPMNTDYFIEFKMPELRLHYLFVFFVFLSILITAFAQCIAKKEDPLKYNVIAFVWITIVAIFCWIGMFNMLGLAGDKGFTFKIHKFYLQYVDDSMSVFQSSFFIILLGMIAINIAFSVAATKCTSRYSTGRAGILRWVAIMFVMSTIWKIGVGCTQTFFQCDSLAADYANVLLIFILVRAMIIPIEAKPGITCDFDSDKDVNIWNIKESNDILEVDTQSLNEKTDLLINYIRILEMRIFILENQVECNRTELSADKKLAEKQIQEIQEILQKSEEAGKPVEYQQFREKTEDINVRRRKKFREVMGIEEEKQE